MNAYLKYHENANNQKYAQRLQQFDFDADAWDLEGKWKEQQQVKDDFNQRSMYLIRYLFALLS